MCRFPVASSYGCGICASTNDGAVVEHPPFLPSLQRKPLIGSSISSPTDVAAHYSLVKEQEVPALMVTQPGSGKIEQSGRLELTCNDPLRPGVQLYAIRCWNMLLTQIRELRH